MVSILMVASWLQNYHCSSGKHIRVQAGSKKKEEGEGVKRKREEERKRLMGKEVHVERYMPSKSAPL